MSGKTGCVDKHVRVRRYECSFTQWEELQTASRYLITVLILIFISSVPEDNITYSTATTLTTTIPLIDLQLNGNHPGIESETPAGLKYILGQIYENENDDDQSSTSSDEILL